MEVSVLFARRTAERTEAATHETNVCEVDVAVYHVRDHIAHSLMADVIGGKNQRFQLAAAGSCKQQPVVEVQLFRFQRPGENTCDRRINRRQQGIQPSGLVPVNVIEDTHLSTPTKSRLE